MNRIQISSKRLTRTQRNYRLLADVLATLGCAVGAAMTLGDLHSPVRSGLIATMLVAGTGWAVTGWIDVTETAYAATLALAAGLSVLFFYAVLFVEIGWWHPVGSVGALLAAAAALNAGAVVRDTLRRTEP
jgi:hypothetical protein